MYHGAKHTVHSKVETSWISDLQSTRTAHNKQAALHSAPELSALINTNWARFEVFLVSSISWHPFYHSPVCSFRYSFFLYSLKLPERAAANAQR